MGAKMNDKEIIEGLETIKQLGFDDAHVDPEYAKGLESFLDAAISRLQSIQWRRIEEAPRDGTIILGWTGTHVWHFTYVDRPDRVDEKGFWFWKKRKVISGYTGWYGVIPSGNNWALMWLRFANNKPTHFIPLSAFNQEEE